MIRGTVSSLSILLKNNVPETLEADRDHSTSCPPSSIAMCLLSPAPFRASSI